MTENQHIDKLDKKILSYIVKDARIAYTEVAKKCDVSSAAIHQRIQRLTKLGIICGSEFIIDPLKTGYLTCAYIGIFLEKATLYNEAVSQLEQIPEVVECHYTTGSYAIFIKVYTRDNDHLKAILSDKLQSIEGVNRTETFISLDQKFKRQLSIE